MTTPHALLTPARATQRGIVTVFVMLFIIAAVIFALAKMLDVSGANVIDGQRQNDSAAAFFLAESGLESTHAAVSGALGAGFTNTSCTALAVTNQSLGRGSYSVTTASTPASCDNSSVTPCSACTATSTGIVGKASRTVKQDIALTSSNGVVCNHLNGSCSNNPVTWKLNLRNGASAGGPAGVGLFALSYDQQGNNTATCNAGSNCRLQLAIGSPNNGSNAIGLQGNAVVIPGGNTYPIYQVMSRADKDLAEVGAFFLGTGAITLTGPTVNPGAASYWKGGPGNHNAVDKTIGVKAGGGGAISTVGGTNDGTATSGGTCDAPNQNAQTCTSWCYGGDTLALSLSASTTTLADTVTSVTFGTNSGTGQNVALTQIAKYPTSLVGGAPVGIDAEIWYASNQNLVSSADGTTITSNPMTGVSSYKGRGSGAIGAQWTSNGSDTTSVNVATRVLTVGASFTGWPNQVISIGDTVSWSGGGGAAPSCPTGTVCGTIVSQVTPTGSEKWGGPGRYNLATTPAPLAVSAVNNRVWTINSSVLRVYGCSICFFANGDALPTGLGSGRTINGAQLGLDNNFGNTGYVETTGGVGRYPISGTKTFAAFAQNNVYAGTPGTTLYVPMAASVNVTPSIAASLSLPSATPDAWPRTMLALRSGTGALVTSTTTTHTQVLSRSAVNVPNAVTRSFTVDNAPGTPLDNATLCAGTCAFFVPGTTTTFSLGLTNNFDYWTAGFTCMKGIDLPPAIVTSSSSTRAFWTEPVQ